MRVGSVELRDTMRQLAAFVREVRAILNGGLTFADNVAGGTRTFSFVVGSPVLLAYAGVTPPAGVLCLSVRESRGDLASVASNLPIRWRHSRGGILVESVDGLTPSVDYTITVAVVEG